MGFEEPAAALREMEGFSHPWFVSGGWASDLFVGEVTREHEDVEIGIFRSHQASVHVDKDEHDFRRTLGALTGSQRAWLRNALTIVHPGDPWLNAL